MAASHADQINVELKWNTAIINNYLRVMVNAVLFLKNTDKKENGIGSLCYLAFTFVSGCLLDDGISAIREIREQQRS
ncbi:hypothetical protein PVOR_16764 [Paenibacillus vortex V453]|uniref:Uncharacterized protein n=2 Tax=Paenibacillus TaxID=44249 RepID=A0A163M929_9BACL|nr:hypothetical protein PVOR_16764 [Paenibacillus vortex V453]KZS48853.1 hypothetical protein AWU65_24405 [Paenibacillus glucanolyticus]